MAQRYKRALEVVQRYGERLVEQILLEELAPLQHYWRGTAPNHNVFLGAISEPLALSSKITRSLTSKLGNRLAAVARRLAAERYGQRAVPSVIHGSSLAETVAPHYGTGDTLVLCRLPQSETREAAIRLLRLAGVSYAGRIGSDTWQEQYLLEMEQLHQAAGEPQPWGVRVDLFVDDPQVGLAELESGGELDTSNAKGQPEKLVLAGLCLGRPDVALHFCCAYANRGEGEPIAGQLKKYLAPDPQGQHGLLVGSQWWARVLPEDVDFACFIRLFSAVAAEMDVVPDDMRTPPERL